jgi:uncharacterized protein with LGFP repeats
MALSVNLKTLSPQPTLVAAGTAQQITTDELTVKSVIIYAADTNTGAVYISTDDTNAKNGKGISLSPGQGYGIQGDRQSGTHQMVKLSSIYFDGATTGNKLVVQYLDI